MWPTGCYLQRMYKITANTQHSFQAYTERAWFFRVFFQFHFVMYDLQVNVSESSKQSLLTYHDVYLDQEVMVD